MQILSARAILAAALFATPVLAQDILEAPSAPPAAGDSLSQARAAEARHDPAEALARYLRALAATPDDVVALTGAGRTALAIGDSGAALGFFARAEDVAPRDGRVKAGLGAAMAEAGRAREALRFFRAAVELGVPVADIAAERGLAYDLRGDWRRAQADYEVALRTRPDEEVTRRLALSQAIGGDRAAALATLDAALRRQDRAAWRTRAFILAMTGDPEAGILSAQSAMVRPQADQLAPYLRRLATLKPSDRAAAVDLGIFPQDRRAVAAPTMIASASVASTPVAGSIAPIRAAPSPTGTTWRLDPSPARPVPPAGAGSSAGSRMTVRMAGPSPATVAAPATAVEPLQPVAPLATPAPTAQRANVPDLPPPLIDAAPPMTVVAATVSPALSAPSTPAPARPTLAVAATALTPQPSAADLLAERRAAAADRRARAQAAAKAAEDKRAKVEAAAEALAEKRNPARHWVQVAGGANASDLPKTWSALKAKWPSQLAGRSPWTLHYRYTNRLLIGPFATADAAQDWVSDRRKEGLAAFRVETNAGDPVDRLAGR